MPFKKILPVKKTAIVEKKSCCCGTSRWYHIVMYVVLVLIVICCGLKLWLMCRQFNQNIDKNTYQVVFLDNNESYFGRLQNIGFKMYKLQDVYYLKSFPKQQETDTSGETTDATSQNDYEFRLIRLGDPEFYKPVNQMIINREHIIYWENLQPSSQVMDFINENK